MKYICFWLFLVVISFPEPVDGQESDYNSFVKRYIETYKEIAIKEMMDYHIPASITLAQGIHESRAGQSKIAIEANNHFGIKCHKDWFGKTYFYDDDSPNECFRKYDSPLESFRDHSYFLTQRDRYKNLFGLDITDYKGWAHGLQAAGYATNPKYAETLIRTIETYSLFQYDRPDYLQIVTDSVRNLDDPVTNTWLRRFQLYAIGPGNRKVFANNELQMTIARKEDNINTLARVFGISEKRLMRYNDLNDATELKPGQIVYLEPKRRRGLAATHTIEMGQTLYQISQLYGIKMKMLVKHNKPGKQMELAPGTILKLR
ncbi:MAG: glucosaminidase domain-containing protein [Bacteroidales bacterium]|nr:glucosaminidase domain-containing protein [Bacteroidales bacterium]